MKALRRIATLFVVLAALISIAASALATEGTEGTATTVAEEPPPTVDFEPAVPITTPPADEALDDWTYRYMVPTAIVLAVVVVVITCVQYFTRVVRRRYRIVEE